MKKLRIFVLSGVLYFLIAFLNFSFSLVSGNLLLSIPPLSPPADGTYARPNGDNASNDPSSGGKVGTIPAEFSVSPLGGATYVVPIECLPGIKGVQPDMAIVYDSNQEQDGILGVGMALSGLSSIAAAPQNLFSNNKVSGINLQETATYYTLDGNGLTGDYNGIVNGTEPVFKTLQDTYSNIQAKGKYQYGNKVLGPDYFEVTTKEGMVMEYAHKVILKNGTAPVQWLITKVTDPNGNYMQFIYDTFRTNQTVLQAVEYTINTAAGLTPHCTVEFSYETKSTVKKTYLAGCPVEDALVLKSIQSKHKDSSYPVRTYSMSYKTVADRYYLTQIGFTGENRQTLNPLVFTWDIFEDDRQYTTISHPIGNFQADMSTINLASADVDGDGFADLVVMHKDARENRYYVKVVKNNYLSAGKPSFSPVLTNKEVPASFEYKSHESRNGGLLVCEFNGDRRKTILLPYFNKSGQSNYMVFADLYSLEKQSSSFVYTGFTHPLQLTSEMTLYAKGDLNNDGIDEVISVENLTSSRTKGGRVFYIDKTPGTDDVLRNGEYNSTSVEFGIMEDGIKLTDIFVSDFDADGLQDILLIAKTGKFYFLKNLGGSPDANGFTKVSFANPIVFNGPVADYRFIKAGDFNGDGLVDFIVNHKTNNYNWYLMMNNGDFTFTSGVLYQFRDSETDRKSEKDDDKDDLIIVDLNGNGRSDAIVINALYPGENYMRTNVNRYLSTGTDFTYDTGNSQVTLFNENCTFQKYNLTGDFNGDGTDDFISYGCCLYANSSTPSTNMYMYNTKVNAKGNKIVRIVNSMAENKIDIQYRRLTHAGNTDWNEKLNYPYASLMFPLAPVSAVITPIDKNTSSTTEYTYGDLEAELTGKGILGFKKITAHNTLSDFYTETENQFDYTYGLLKEQTQTVYVTRKTNPVSMSKSLYSSSKTGLVYRNLLSYTESVDYLSNLSASVDVYSFDAYGNPLTVVKTNDKQKEITDYTYGKYASWCNNLPEKVTVTCSNSGLYDPAYIRETRYEYDSKGNITKLTVDPGDVNEVVTRYSNHDACGQPQKIQVTASGQTRTTIREYTGSKRFLLRETDTFGEMTTYAWDERRNVLNSKTDTRGITKYTFDYLNRPEGKEYFDGIKEAYTVQWASSSSSTPYKLTGARYYRYEEVSGSAPVITWYDDYGREIATKTYGPDKQSVRVFKEYDEMGRLKRISEPTFGSQAESWAVTYNYDPYNRIISEITPAGTTNITYDGRKTTVVSPNENVQYERNAQGQMYRIFHNDQGIINTYYPSGKLKRAKPGGSAAVEMEYDLQGNRTKLTDPDGGTIESRYDGWGQLVWEKQSVHTSGNAIETDYKYNWGGDYSNRRYVTGKLLRMITTGSTVFTGLKAPPDTTRSFFMIIPTG